MVNVKSIFFGNGLTPYYAAADSRLGDSDSSGMLSGANA
jgi:hypothetical protein